ncbi:MAG: SixA phosphatase family protein [Bosea sp. (in: a-proteobacteria)]
MSATVTFMRRLLILRHAKSDWPSGFSDFDRPLAARGKLAAPMMGHYLKQEGLIPDLAIISSARRTVETWNLLHPELGEDVHHRFEKRIYEAPYESLVEVIKAAPDTVRTLLLVGHNPGSEELASAMIGYGDRFAAQRMQKKYPTAGLCVLDFEIGHWSDMSERSARLDRFVTPASLGHGPDE